MIRCTSMKIMIRSKKILVPFVGASKMVKTQPIFKKFGSRT